MEQFCGMFGLPRHITWPVGFTVMLLVLGLVGLALRKRSKTWAAISAQGFAGFVAMVLVSALIFATLPAEAYTKASEAVSTGECEKLGQGGAGH